MSGSTDAVDILLVEDSVTDAELCIDSLRKRNLVNKLVWAKDGQEALNLLFGTSDAEALPPTSPKVILLDLRLPKVDGLEVLRRIRANDQTRLLPVVVLTSSTEERDFKAAYELGVNSFSNRGRTPGNG